MVDIPMRKRGATSKAEYWDTKLIELRHSQLVDGRAVCGKLEGSANAHTVGGVPLTTGVSSLTVVNECPDAGAAPDE